MKAIICSEWGKPEKLTLGELPSPTVKASEVRIGIHACGINFADTLIVQGLYQEKPTFPFTPGSEIAGEVLEVGAGVTHLNVGDRVAALCSIGGMAEEVVAHAASVVPIPAEMEYPTAAGFMVAYGTAHVALEHRAKLQAGETLLVHGAAGGVGLAAVEIGKQMGATVIATASTAEKLAIAKAHGADHLINYRDEPEFRNQVKELTNGKGANVILDPVGGDVFNQSMRCIAWEGRLLVIGFASGTIPKVPANLTLVKNVSVVGLYWGAYNKHDPKVLTDSLSTLYKWFVAGHLKPHISQTFPLEEAADALNFLIDRKATGKVVVETR